MATTTHCDTYQDFYEVLLRVEDSENMSSESDEEEKNDGTSSCELSPKSAAEAAADFLAAACADSADSGSGYNNAPISKHWNGVKAIFCYLKETTDLGLFYTHKSSKGVATLLGPRVDSNLVGYADAGYLSNPHWARSQMGYVFTVGDIVISWTPTKQMLVATSSNHAEILALRKA
ncbi:uncharacterized protein LOC125469456 [Pyrus x bretschneideri]|uniref:uncharacterized protein LOC125469456 n=1 Tax=Pyrus x bretschneideri TaxID=225117 RepID=UPI00202E9831|nr:uncharacterized protein LOC125469456 [Pyrus x bretschneideri]